MDPSFDRGEVDRASLEATERLRQRLAEERKTRPGGARSRTMLPWVFVGGLLVFLAGMIANPWFEARVRDQLPFTPSAPPAPVVAEVEALRDRLALLEARPQPSEDAPPPNERLARTEARVETSTDLLAREADRIDRLTADLATLNARLEADRVRDEAATTAILSAADRAEGMLAVMLARRALEEGRPLGAIDAALRRAFEVRYPAAVNALAAYGANPVRLAQLRQDLETMAGLEGAAGGRGRSWWDIFGTRVSRLISPAEGPDIPASRSAADAALARGDVRTAAGLLRRLPAPRPAALQRWLVAADRYATAEEALRTLETAALIPRASMIELAPSPPAS
ncbi:COG4223 family protein [Polymorphobacter sp.]|uniref:COG4223 family protein n=1 Tax=Polymorphobacter sp. TaxID=1909290 RepID=UPI003F6EDB92